MQERWGRGWALLLLVDHRAAAAFIDEPLITS
jgi:hypothetical protein